MSKSELGQFYTTNYAHILQGLHVPDHVDVVEPFCGAGDLVKWIGRPCELWDIDPKIDGCERRDTLLHPPTYAGRWVLTNPPYLAKNKATDKRAMNLYGVDDLYKCFLESILMHPPDGGVIIIPLNFWCGVRGCGATDRFCRKFWVRRMNVFEEQVFDDTTCTVCAIEFVQGPTNGMETSVHIFPGDIEMTQVLDRAPFGRDIHRLPQNSSITITRLTPANRDDPGRTHIHMKCFDDIHLWWDDQTDYMDNTPRLTQRMYGTLVINPPPMDQVGLVDKFNAFLQEKRAEHRSLFLTNYRERDRKRISFTLIYSILNWCHSLN